MEVSVRIEEVFDKFTNYPPKGGVFQAIKVCPVYWTYKKKAIKNKA